MNTFDPNHTPSTTYFKVGQKVVVFNSQVEILFLRRSAKCSRAGGWDFPGGGLENEQPLAGIKRETKEEANIEITSVYPTSSITYENVDSDIQTLTIGYTARLESGEVQLSWEHDEFRWLSIEEALMLDLPKGHKLFLEKAIEYQKTTALRSLLTLL